MKRVLSAVLCATVAISALAAAAQASAAPRTLVSSKVGACSQISFVVEAAESAQVSRGARSALVRSAEVS
jgi:hypothetical protein